MTKIILISCASKKTTKKVKAKNLYISPLFKLGLKYARSLNPDKIFILSAKYGLLNLEPEIEPYNKTLHGMSDEEIKLWAENILEELSKFANLEKDKFIFLAGEKYRKYLLPHIKNYQIPLKGLGIGKQLKFLKDKTNNKCKQLHKLFNNMKRLSFPFNEKEIPENGIYVLFEKGEKAHGADRIVRIGTHTGQNNLKARLKEHFLNENKDRSIFRKNIGRCLLKGDPFIKQWELTPLIREVRLKHPEIDFKKQQEIEKQVSKFIQDNFEFAIIPIDSKEERLKLESKIISTVSLCKECKPSGNWFGLNSSKQKIRESGLWLVNELYKEPISEKDFEKLMQLTQQKV